MRRRSFQVAEYGNPLTDLKEAEVIMRSSGSLQRSNVHFSLLGYSLSRRCLSASVCRWVFGLHLKDFRERLCKASMHESPMDT